MSDALPGQLLSPAQGGLTSVTQGGPRTSLRAALIIPRRSRYHPATRDGPAETCDAFASHLTTKQSDFVLHFIVWNELTSCDTRASAGWSGKWRTRCAPCQPSSSTPARPAGWMRTTSRSRSAERGWGWLVFIGRRISRAFRQPYPAGPQATAPERPFMGFCMQHINQGSRAKNGSWKPGWQKANVDMGGAIYWHPHASQQTRQHSSELSSCAA